MVKIYSSKDSKVIFIICIMFILIGSFLLFVVKVNGDLIRFKMLFNWSVIIMFNIRLMLVFLMLLNKLFNIKIYIIELGNIFWVWSIVILFCFFVIIIISVEMILNVVIVIISSNMSVIMFFFILMVLNSGFWCLC